MKNIIITNNPDVKEKFKDVFSVEFLDEKTYMDVLYCARDLIHKGHELLTHPLSGSVKPNETPYKSIIVSSKTGYLDKTGLTILEESIQTVIKFTKNKKTPNWTERVLDDFRVIDLSIMENVIDRLGHK
ncbi:MAG: GrdX protein [Tissierellia bacterium]|nr:GrdX protein [Tissierellia bacterium]